jgi:hypothetical protein
MLNQEKTVFDSKDGVFLPGETVTNIAELAFRDDCNYSVGVVVTKEEWEEKARDYREKKHTTFNDPPNMVYIKYIIGDFKGEYWRGDPSAYKHITNIDWQFSGGNHVS